VSEKPVGGCDAATDYPPLTPYRRPRWEWVIVSAQLMLVKCDTQGNVYAGCGDGIHVWSRSLYHDPTDRLLDKHGTLIGRM
jgi:hypothetical protein